MAQTYSNETRPFFNSATPVLIARCKYGGGVQNYRASITLASQASGDTVFLAVIPAGVVFARGWLTGSASLGSATVAIGNADSPGKYRAAATFTTADTPTVFGVAASKADAEPLTVPETVILTIAAASLPSSGSLVVDLEFAGD